MAIIDVIKYDGTDLLIWKYPKTEFNNNSQLIVNEAQEAIFFSDGEQIAVYGPGKHSLETANLPVVKSLMKFGTGGKKLFNTELYFINRTEQMAIKWGTNSKIQYMDPEYNFPISIGACGQMSLAVGNSSRLLIKLLGTGKALTNDQIADYFRSFIMNRVKSLFPTIVINKRISIFMIDQNLQLLSDECKDKISSDMLDYGIELRSFLITTILKPDDDPNYVKFKDIHFRRFNEVAEAELQQKIAIIEQQTKAQQVVIEAEAVAQKRKIEGYTYQQERGYDVAQKIAENEATGQIGNIGVGLGMLSGIGGSLGSHVGGVVGESLSPAKCRNCGSSIKADDVFCSKCGTKVQSSVDTCSNCGFSFEDDAAFCPKCGTRRGEI